MGGFDIYVNASSAYIVPTGAARGSLIVNPFATVICINDAGIQGGGGCSVQTANGPGVVEVSTIESSGSNECSGMATCSGMAFTITYEAVAPIASTSISYPTGTGCSTSSVATPRNVCVLVSDATGTLEGLRCVLQLLGKLASKSALSESRKGSEQNRHQSDNHNHEPYRSEKPCIAIFRSCLSPFKWQEKKASDYEGESEKRHP